MPAKIPPAAAIVAIALVIAVLTIHRLGAGDVCTGNEAVEGVFVQQMVEHGHLLFPVGNGNVPMYKPPLFHWTAVALDRLAGIRKVTAANLRIPSALYAIAGAMLAMLFAYNILGLDALAKGPVGAILPSATILIFMVAERRSRQILTMLDPGALILGAAIASSWYLACYFGGRFAFLNRQLDTENVGRFFGSLGAMAPWYYLKPVLLNSAPLSILVPIAATYALLTPLLSSQSGNSEFNTTSPPGGGD